MDFKTVKHYGMSIVEDELYLMKFSLSFCLSISRAIMRKYKREIGWDECYRK